MRLRVHEGINFQKIAELVGFKDAAAAQRAVERAIRRLPLYPPDQFQRMTTERLEHLYYLIHRKAEEDDATAIKVAAGIAAQQAKLNGVDGKKNGGEEETTRIPITAAREVLDRFNKVAPKDK